MSEGDPNGPHKIVLRHWIRRHRHLVAGADDQVDRPGRGVIGELEAPEDETGREQNLIPARMCSVGPVGVVDLQFRPKILEQMILECRIEEHRIAEVSKGRAGLWLRTDRIAC